MKEYQIIEHYIIEAFIELVNESLAEGWLPCGGVNFAYTKVGQGTYHKHYTQAMIRDKPPDFIEVGRKQD